MIEKDRQDMSNPIGLFPCKLMLCSVFALLPYPHKANVFKGFGLGAICGTRTHDLLITNQLLYQLS